MTATNLPVVTSQSSRSEDLFFVEVFSCDSRPPGCVLHVGAESLNQNHRDLPPCWSANDCVWCSLSSSGSKSQLAT